MTAATDLLISDLEYMASAWADDGAAREALDAMGEDGALAAMLIGMGSLSYGELAGERMQLGLMLHDPEEEHDCFTDNSSTSHYYDGRGQLPVWGEKTASLVLQLKNSQNDQWVADPV